MNLNNILNEFKNEKNEYNKCLTLKLLKHSYTSNNLFMLEDDKLIKLVIVNTIPELNFYLEKFKK